MKKSPVLIFAFWVIILSACLPLAARARLGSTVVVTMADGGQIEGELLAVKTDTLLVYDSAAGQGRAIDLAQAVQVKVLKRSKVMLGLAIGVGAGFVGTMFDVEGWIHESVSMKPVIASALIGGALGTLAGSPEKFSRHGKFFLNAQELAWLRAHARKEE